MRVIFSHGMESGPWGEKIRVLAEDAEALGCAVTSLDYRGMVEPGPRIDKLLTYAGELEEPYLLVGSSMGAYVALCAAQRLQPHGLLLLAPAFSVLDWSMPESPRLPVETQLIHGWGDEVISWRNSLAFAESNRCGLRLVDADHRLMAAMPVIRAELQRMIHACL